MHVTGLGLLEPQTFPFPLATSCQFLKFLAVKPNSRTETQALFSAIIELCLTYIGLVEMLVHGSS